MTQNAGWSGMLEMINETTYGILPTNPEMEYIGVITTGSINDKPIIESGRFLPQNDYTDTVGQTRTSAYYHQKTTSEITVETEYNPKDIETGFMLYALGNPVLTAGTAVTGAVDGLGTSFSVGSKILSSPKYLVYSGGYVTDFSLEVARDGLVNCSSTAMFANAGVNAGSPGYANTANPMASDYIGTGSHADGIAGDILAFSDITSSTLTPAEGSAADDIVESISINISNNIRWIKDLGGGFSTKISSAALLGRDITIGLELAYDELALYSSIYAGKKFTYEMTLDGYIFEFGGFVFPEYPVSMNPEELLGETIESTQATSFKIIKPAA